MNPVLICILVCVLLAFAFGVVGERVVNRMAYSREIDRAYNKGLEDGYYMAMEGSQELHGV